MYHPLYEMMLPYGHTAPLWEIHDQVVQKSDAVFDYPCMGALHDAEEIGDQRLLWEFCLFERELVAEDEGGVELLVGPIETALKVRKEAMLGKGAVDGNDPLGILSLLHQLPQSFTILRGQQLNLNIHSMFLLLLADLAPLHLLTQNRDAFVGDDLLDMLPADVAAELLQFELNHTTTYQLLPNTSKSAKEVCRFISHFYRLGNGGFGRQVEELFRGGRGMGWGKGGGWVGEVVGRWSAVYSKMGNSKSEEYGSLIRRRQASQWLILDDQGTHQLWQQKSTYRRYLVFTLDVSQTDSQQKLQLFHFRKLNHAHLVTIEYLLSHDSDFLCSTPKNWHLLVEYVPLRLDKFKNALSFREGLTVLAAAFSGYHILNYVYGPLFASQETICFNEQGLPKVWVNENLGAIEPSKRAKGEAEGSVIDGLGLEREGESLQEKTFYCVRKLFAVIERAISSGYPLDFKQQASNVRTFAEGEELVEGFCRRRGIELEETIPLEKVNRVEPLHLATESYLNSDRLSIQNLHQPNPSLRGTITIQDHMNKRYPSTNYITSQLVSAAPPPIQLTSSNRPLRASLTNPNIKFVFQQPLQPLNHQLPQPQQPVVKYAAPPLRLQQPFVYQSHPIPPPPILHPLYTAQPIPIHHILPPQPPLAQPQQQKPPTTAQPTKIQRQPQRQMEPQPQKQVQPDSKVTAPLVETHIIIDHSHSLDRSPLAEQLRNQFVSSVESHEEINPYPTPEKEQPEPTPVPEVEQEDNEEELPDLHQHSNITRLTSPQPSRQEEPLYNSPREAEAKNQAVDELKNWEESLMKLSVKQSQKKRQEQEEREQREEEVRELHLDPDRLSREESESQQYLSEERDKVYVTETRDPIHNFTSEQDLQAYIRSKYSEYLTSDREIAPPTYDQPPPTPKNYKQPLYPAYKPAYEDYAAPTREYFQQNYEQYEDYPTQPNRTSQRELTKPLQDYKKTFNSNYLNGQRKYTFGKIELDPISAYQQYSKARVNEDNVENIEQYSSNKRIRQLNSRVKGGSIEQRYAKYVKNKQPRSILSSKDISYITRNEDSLRNASKREYLYNEYMNNSFKLEEKQMSPIHPKDSRADSGKKGLSYDQLRALLWE